MFFPSPSGCFQQIIKKQKKEHYVDARGRCLEEEAEIIQKVYGCPMEVDDNMKRKKKKKKVRHSNVDPSLILEGPKIEKTMDMKVDSKTMVDSEGIDSPRIKIEKGKKLKLTRFLSNNGQTNHLVRFQKGCYGGEVDFDSLTVKQLLICCFSVPMFSNGEVADRCRAVIEMYDHGQPFEMVVVVKMRTDVACYDRKAAFDHFYSAFSSCLAVPFSDVETRDYICACFITSFELDQEKVDCAILVDPNGLILEGDYTLDNFLYYGLEWSPISTLEEINKQDHALRCRLDPIHARRYTKFPNKYGINLSLYGDILLCNPHRTLRRFESSDVGSVLELSTKYVGLYLCFNGRIIEKIKAVHDYCLANKQQLEIVLVCMSLFEEPAAYYQQLYQMLRLFDVKSWFLFDYDGKVCRRLWRVFGFGENFPGEKFIVVPPNCESGELFGREMITHNGVTEYPFTRSAILKRRLELLRSLTPLDSTLFKTGTLSHKGEEFDSELLRGKKFLLYLDDSQICDDSLYRLVMEHYTKIKAMGWEVVFVPMDAPYKQPYLNKYMEGQPYIRIYFDPARLSKIDKMPWPVMSVSAALEASVKNKIIFPDDFSKQIWRLVAVGKDGNIVSRQAYHGLETSGVTESLFDDFLETELTEEMAFMHQIEDDDHDDDYY